MSNKIKNQEILFSPGSTYWGDVWLQFKKHKGALLGAIIFFGIVITVMLGPYLWPFEPNAIDIRSRNQGPSLLHPFGTDQLGRDTFSRMIAGGQTSITVGLAAMFLSLVLGTFIPLSFEVFSLSSLAAAASKRRSISIFVICFKRNITSTNLNLFVFLKVFSIKK